jgi:CheY-like chemotaxis protein
VGTPAVIVVEDDPFVRDLASTMLEETDLDVLEAVSVEDALVHLNARGPDVKTGVRRSVAAREARRGRPRPHDRARWPWIKVVVTSGNPGDRLNELPENAEYMPKPWRALDVLIQAERVAAAA